jgi:hypothetical protein
MPGQDAQLSTRGLIWFCERPISLHCSPTRPEPTSIAAQFRGGGAAGHLDVGVMQKMGRGGNAR